MATVFCWLSYY